MFEAFIMVCSVYNFMDCRTFKDLNGPYVEMEKCVVRIEEMKLEGWMVAILRAKGLLT